MSPRLCAALCLGVLAAPAGAGHSRFPYFDGGQSADGRYVVTARLVERPATAKGRPGKGEAAYHWEYTWKDAKTGKTITGKLEGLRSGKNAVFDPVHGHVFVAPGGETFAVWNPQVLAPTPGNQKPPKDLTDKAARDFAGFSHRLTVYQKTGEIVKRFDLKDFLKEEDRKWVFCYGCQVYWQKEYPGLATRSAPRPGYALFRVSPDYTVLETTVGATDEAARHAKAKGVTPPAPRVVRVHLTEARLLREGEKLTDPAKVPVRPFKGELAGKAARQQDYVPNLDPVRLAGSYAKSPAEPGKKK